MFYELCSSVLRSNVYYIVGLPVIVQQYCDLIFFKLNAIIPFSYCQWVVVTNQISHSQIILPKITLQLLFYNSV